MHLETTDGAETGNRRRGEHRNEGFLDSRKFAVQPHRNRATAESRVFALLERLQCHEHDAGVRAVGEPIDGQAGKLHSGFDAGFLERDLTHTADDILGAIKRRAVGQLREANQILLVLTRHEAARHGLEQPVGSSDQRDISDHKDDAS